MNVNDMYRICQFAINKAQNGYLTPSEFNLIINQAQVSYQNYLLGDFQQYQYGRPQAKVNYSQNETIRQRLTPLIIKVPLSIIGTTGTAAYPSDFLQVDAMWESDGVHRIRFVPQDSFYSYFNSQIDLIADNPIYLLEKNNFQFYPTEIFSISGNPILSYVRTAPDIVWGYCLDANGRPVYNPTIATTTTTTTTLAPGTTTTTAAPTTTTTTTSSGCTQSVQPVWYDVDNLEIISRALKLIGLNLQIGQIEQYANQVTQIGQ